MSRNVRMIAEASHVATVRHRTNDIQTTLSRSSVYTDKLIILGGRGAAGWPGYANPIPGLSERLMNSSRVETH